MSSIKNNLIPAVTVIVPDIASFGFILQQGFDVFVMPGCSLRSLLFEQFGIKAEYIETRIKTAFINGKPVDDFDTAIINDNITLALSAAMPGLVGATFRCGGILSPFRAGISFQNTENKAATGKSGRITIKLFNLLVKELGPVFLEKGIIIDTGTFLDLLKMLNGNVKKIGIDDNLFDIDQIQPVLEKSQSLKVLLIALAGAT